MCIECLGSKLFIFYQHIYQFFENSWWILKVDFIIVYYISVTFFYFIKNTLLISIDTFLRIKQNTRVGYINSSEGTELMVLGEALPKVNATQKQKSAIVSLPDANADHTDTNQMYILLPPLIHLFMIDLFTIQSST